MRAAFEAAVEAFVGGSGSRIGWAVAVCTPALTTSQRLTLTPAMSATNGAGP